MIASLTPASGSSSELAFDGPAQGLVGNGRSVVVATPQGFHYHLGAGGDGKLRVVVSAGQPPLDLDRLPWKTSAFPGGIIFTHRAADAAGGGGSIEIFHTALPDDPYGVLARFTGVFADAVLSVEGGPRFHARTAPSSVAGDGASGTVAGFSETGKIANADFNALRAAVLAPYTERGMVLRSPDPALDLAVLFNQYLLDLSYDGNLIVCELFRYRDIWSRDLGSGFVPGSLFTNRIEAARKCIDVDLARHEKATARALKTTPDASQGGSAEGVAHLTTALWDYYLITGDRAYLTRVTEGIRPWVEAWLARDYAHAGLIVDTTDWMDHSRYQMLPFGARTLYANAQMVRLLDTFARIESELGDATGGARFAGERDRFIAGINERLWNENLGAYANLLLAGQQDERTASAANSLALLGGVADPARAARVLETLQTRNWRPHGTLTITPPMTFNPHNDQNEKIWPWWVAYEALARFRYGDAEGGVRLLDTCAATIRNSKYPGMMDETMDRNGHSEGGRAFATAAGSLLTSVYKGLFGIEILAGGMREIKVVPNLPAGWRDASLHQPTPGGALDIEVRGGVLHVTVRDGCVRVVHTTADAVVTGAEKRVWQAPPAPTNRAGSVARGTPVPPPAFAPRPRAVCFEEPGFPRSAPTLPDHAALPRVGWRELATLDAAKIGAVVVPGSALPFLTPEGQPIQRVLDHYLAGGGTLIFRGVTMRPNHPEPRRQLGGDGGVVEWFGHEAGDWFPVHPRTGQREERPQRDGTIYWEPGRYFGGWDLERGAFGFETDGRGIRLAAGSPLPPAVENADARVSAAFTDFAVSSPWYFQTLATTHTTYNFLLPAQGEDLPCVVRLVNRETHGEIILIANGAEGHVDVESLLAASTVGD